MLLRSSVTGKIVRSIQLDLQFSTACRRLKWYRRNAHDNALVEPHDGQSGTSRLLLADNGTIHLYDALDAEWHVCINGTSNNTGKIANVDFGYTPNEIVVFSDFGMKVTIWSLLSNHGVEIRDPKFSSCGYCFRPRTGHLAILTRETTKDVVMVLAPGTRELENSFTLATVDAQGLKWSSDGRWLVTWEAASAGYNVLVCTSEGHLFRTYSGGQDVDRPGLGVKTVTWEPSERFLVVACYNHRITLLSSSTVSTPLIGEGLPLTFSSSSPSPFSSTQVSSTVSPVQSGKSRLTLPKAEVTSPAYSPLAYPAKLLPPKNKHNPQAYLSSLPTLKVLS